MASPWTWIRWWFHVSDLILTKNGTSMLYQLPCCQIPLVREHQSCRLYLHLRVSCDRLYLDLLRVRIRPYWVVVRLLRVKSPYFENRLYSLVLVRTFRRRSKVAVDRVFAEAPFIIFVIFVVGFRRSCGEVFEIVWIFRGRDWIFVDRWWEICWFYSGCLVSEEIVWLRSCRVLVVFKHAFCGLACGFLGCGTCCGFIEVIGWFHCTRCVWLCGCFVTVCVVVKKNLY